MEFRYTALERVITDADAAEILPRVMTELGVSRALLVASGSLAKSTDDFAELRSALGARCVGLCRSIRAHTPREDVLAAAQLAREKNADLLIALGGGSIIDACKAIQLIIDQDLQGAADLLQYAQRSDGTRGPRVGDDSLFSNTPRIRQIAIPTTLSGAEYSNNAGVLDTRAAAKEGYRAPNLCPQVIIYDPALCAHTPEWLWLSTAIRSLDHAIEGYCSAESTPYLDGHFLHAMRLFKQSLPAAHGDLADLAARDLNQQAVWLACCGLGTVAHGASHGIGYILGSYCGVPHGHTSCVMLPAVLAWNASTLSERQGGIAQALGMPGSSASAAVATLITELGLPTTLAQVGVKEEQLDAIANRAIAHPVVRKNPRPLQSATQVREILDLAWRGPVC
ncbi:MAG: iron-containing alcohol dehydrogenase [Proteobacteria bacterium]|nr:iron-containing alcohol dehydrogenase [Pseudomonadota bacterium]MDA0927760.1 iron-containing alcohol dehydrogenase [Pseudomonadota bacterium]